jgi:putative membrane protein
MHLTTFGAAVLVWHALLERRRFGPAALAGVLTAAQMSLLGALLTLAPRPLFDPHALTTAPWDLSPLEDQQLGGLIMWVPGGLLLTAYALGGFGLWLKSLDEPASAGS